MQKFKVKVTETYVKYVFVEADTEANAIDAANNWAMFNDEVVDNHDEFHIDIAVVKED